MKRMYIRKETNVARITENEKIKERKKERRNQSKLKKKRY